MQFYKNYAYQKNTLAQNTKISVNKSLWHIT